jgi:hypothetical protein
VWNEKIKKEKGKMDVIRIILDAIIIVMCIAIIAGGRRK